MGRPLVLLIEDDEWVADLLVTALRDASFEVSVATTAEGGLQLAASVGPDCIVCDFALSDHDGAWFAGQLRANPWPVGAVPLLLVSSRDEPYASTSGFEAGVDAFMAKPFRLDEVVGQIRALIAFASRLSAAGPPASSRGRTRRPKSPSDIPGPTASSSPPPAEFGPSGSAPPSLRSLLAGPPTSVLDLLPPSTRGRIR
jgi:DNA-binding response OmpR family regulator